MPKFHRIARKSDIPEGEGRPFDAGDRRVAVFNVGGELFAIDDVCPHRGASLGRGRLLRDHIICCPLHNWEFDVRNGHMQMAPGVESFPLKIEGDEVWVEV